MRAFVLTGRYPIRTVNGIRTFAVVLTLLGLSAFPSSTAAQQPDSARAGLHPERPHERGPGDFGRKRHGPLFGLEDPSEMIERLRKDLELTEEQTRDIRGLAEIFRSEHADALERMRRLREEMRAAWELEDRRPDREDMDAILEKYGRPFRELHPDLFELREDVLERLTDEQRQRLDSMRGRWHGRARECVGPGHGERDRSSPGVESAPAP